METRHTIEILLVRNAALSRDEFQRSLQAALPALTGATLAFAMPGDVLQQSAQGASGAGLTAIDAVLEIAGSARATLSGLARALPRFDARLAAQLDLGRSGILAGTEYTIMPGDGPVRLFCPLRRLERLSRQEFQDYWLDVHAEFGRKPDNRYRQFHSDEGATAIAAAATGIPASPFDGAALAFFDDIDHLRAKLASPEIAREAFADEQRFIDHARSQFLPFLTSAFSAQR